MTRLFSGFKLYQERVEASNEKNIKNKKNEKKFESFLLKVMFKVWHHHEERQTIQKSIQSMRKRVQWVIYIKARLMKFSGYCHGSFFKKMFPF